MTPLHEGTLKLIVLASGDRGDVARGVRNADADAMALGPNAWAAFTSTEPSALRDAIVAAAADADVIVVEFERWSSHGDSIDRDWLLRRGH